MLPLWIRLYRVLFGAIGMLAVWESAHFEPDGHFLDYFTNQSGIIASGILLLGALLFARRRNSACWDIVRGSGVIMMLTTGIVYGLLVGSFYNPFDTSEHWSSTILHQLLPIVMLFDLLIVPLARQIPWWTVVLFLLYPLVYCGFWLWQGDRNGWYPYDFINPNVDDKGLTGVFATVGGLLAFFIVLGFGVIAYSRFARNRNVTHESVYSRY